MIQFFWSWNLTIVQKHVISSFVIPRKYLNFMGMQHQIIEIPF